MVTTQMKTDAQRLGNGKKAFNVKQVEKMLEDAGGSYTAGTGIDITDDEISVDTTTIQEKLTAGDGIAITDNVISALGSGWEVVPVADRGNLFDANNLISEDIIVLINTAPGSSANFMTYFVPKGINITTKLPIYYTKQQIYDGDVTIFAIADRQLNMIIKNNTNSFSVPLYKPVSITSENGILTYKISESINMSCMNTTHIESSGYSIIVYRRA